MTIYCAVCGDIKPNPKNKTCCRSCATKLGWSDERMEKHKETFNPIMGGAGKRKGVKNKNPYPRTEKVNNRLINNSLPSWKGKKHTEETKEKMSASRIKIIEERGLVLAYKGKFTPKYPQKYMGDPTNIIYRSMWEKKVMNSLDENLNVVRWASEEIIIPYISPVDNKRHRYFPDFYVEAVGRDGETRKMLLEVKPKAQTLEPKKQSRKTKRYITEVVTYGINQAKWKAAEEFCKDKGWEFRLITETELFKK